MPRCRHSDETKPLRKPEMMSPTTESMEVTARRARERLIEDLVSAEPGFTEEGRRRLAVFCVRKIPDGVDCKDGVAVLSILVRMGILDLVGEDDEDYFDILHSIGFWEDTNWEGRNWEVEGGDEDSDAEMNYLWRCAIDGDGRVAAFEIYARFDEPYDLPVDIVRLERLAELFVRNCRSLPFEELQNMPHLQELGLNGCTDLLENFPAETKLANLKRLHLYHCHLRSPSSPFFTLMADQLTNLEELGFHCMEESIDCIWDALRTRAWCFGEGLKTLFVKDSSVGDKSFETLLLEILPARFPNLSFLDLEFNEIESLRPIVDRIKNGKTRIVPHSALRRLNIDENPVMGKLMEGNLEEKAAVLSLLRTFNRIHYLRDWDLKEFPPDVEHALSINHAGRCFLEGNDQCRGGGDYDRPILPLSAWPLVLERAYKNSDMVHSFRFGWRVNKRATGLHYLLRHGPALAGRAAFFGDNDDAGKKRSAEQRDAEKKEKKPSKKRKLAA